MSSTSTGSSMTPGRRRRQSRFFVRATRARRYQDKQFWQSVHKTGVHERSGRLRNEARLLSIPRERRVGTGRLDRGMECRSQGDRRMDRRATLSGGITSPPWARSSCPELPVDRNCVLLTLAPYDATKRAEAQAIARCSWDCDLVAPQLNDVRTFDGSHLDRPSAERWSQGILRRCRSSHSEVSGQLSASLLRAVIVRRDVHCFPQHSLLR